MLRKILPAFMLLAVSVLTFAFTPVKKESAKFATATAVLNNGTWQTGNPSSLCPDGNILCGVQYDNEDFATPALAGSAAQDAKAQGAQHGVAFEVEEGVFITIYEKP